MKVIKMSFQNEFKTHAGSVKTRSQQNIGSGFSFYCASISISRKVSVKNTETDEMEDQMLFPSETDLKAWLVKLYSPAGELAYKPLNEQALKNMQLKGLTPKKQPSQIMNILITSSDVSNIVLVHFPNDLKTTDNTSVDIELFLKNIKNSSDYSMEKFKSAEAVDYLLTFTYENTEKTSFKESMTLERLFFEQLRACGLMKDEDEDEDEDDDDDA